MVKIGVSFKSATHKKIEQAEIDQKNIKQGDLLYVMIVDKGSLINYTVVKLEKTEGENIGYIRKGKMTYSNFNDDLDLSASDFSEKDFESELIKISLKGLHSYGAISLFDEEGRPQVAIMNYQSIIK